MSRLPAAATMLALLAASLAQAHEAHSAAVPAAANFSTLTTTTPAASGLRIAGPLEIPTSPFLQGTKLCTANSDGNRRDNSPSSAGELGGAGGPRGKIACMDPHPSIPGSPLPVSEHGHGH